MLRCLWELHCGSKSIGVHEAKAHGEVEMGDPAEYAVGRIMHPEKQTKRHPLCFNPEN